MTFRQQLLPARHLAEIALDLGLRGEDQRSGVALDDRLDDPGDAAQVLQQQPLAQILGRGAEGLRMGQPARAAALRPRIRAGVMLLLKDGLVIELLDALRQVDAVDSRRSSSASRAGAGSARP